MDSGESVGAIKMGLLKNDLIKNRDTEKSECTATVLAWRWRTRSGDGS